MHFLFASNLEALQYELDNFFDVFMFCARS